MMEAKDWRLRNAVLNYCGAGRRGEGWAWRVTGASDTFRSLSVTRPMR